VNDSKTTAEEDVRTTVWAVELDDEFALVRDGAICSMLDQGLDLDDVARVFCVSLDEVVSVLLNT